MASGSLNLKEMSGVRRVGLTLLTVSLVSGNRTATHIDDENVVIGEAVWRSNTSMAK